MEIKIFCDSTQLIEATEETRREWKIRFFFRSKCFNMHNLIRLIHEKIRKMSQQIIVAPLYSIHSKTQIPINSPSNLNIGCRRSVTFLTNFVVSGVSQSQTPSVRDRVQWVRSTWKTQARQRPSFLRSKWSRNSFSMYSENVTYENVAPPNNNLHPKRTFFCLFSSSTSRRSHICIRVCRTCTGQYHDSLRFSNVFYLLFLFTAI